MIRLRLHTITFTAERKVVLEQYTVTSATEALARTLPMGNISLPRRATIREKAVALLFYRGYHGGKSQKLFFQR